MKIIFDGSDTKYSVGLVRNKCWGFDVWAQTDNLEVARQIKDELIRKNEYNFIILKQTIEIDEVE
jgi:hypothetical protein